MILIDSEREWHSLNAEGSRVEQDLTVRFMSLN